MKNELMLTDNGYQQLMKHACRLAQDGHGELAQHLRDAIDLRARIDAAPAAPQQAEPVGYFVNDESDDQWHQVDYEQRNGADTYPLYLHPPAAPQQAKPMAQIGWADEFGNLFPMGAWKPTQRTHHDSHKTAWRPVFLHPPAAEVQQAEPAISVNVLQASDGSWILQVPEYFPKLSAGWHDLYLHPPADEVQRLRAAAQVVLAMVEAIGRRAFTTDGWAAVLELRRALEGGE